MSAEDERKRGDVAFAATLASDAGSLPRTRPGDMEPKASRDTQEDVGPSGERPVDARLSEADLGLAATLASDGGGASSGAPSAVHPSVTITSEHPKRYDHQSEIGRGGMGRVVVAMDRHLGRTVAMKELLGGAGLADLGLSIGTVARFLREARITGQLEHPGIVPVHELGRRADGTLYYTMKRIRGRSLAAVLKESRTLEDRLRLLGAFRSVCEAMAYAHSRGVVHRDLKPDNVMVGEFGDTLVVDWGLAKVRGEDEAPLATTAERIDVLASADAAQTVGGVAMGTPAYMSPEQARGDLKSIDERTDVWGLGAMLFEILTGRPPFVGRSVLDVLQQVMEERPKRVRELEPDAPPELAAIVERALLADPTSRYPSAKEVAAEISAWQDGRQVRAYEYSAWDRVQRFVKRNRAATIAVAVVASALVGSSALIYRSYLHEEAARVHAETERDAAEHAMHGEEASARRAEIAVAEALLDRAERALADGDPSGAAVLAAGVLLQDEALASAGSHPLEPSAHTRALERDVRARSIGLEAAERSRYVFERIVSGAHHRSALSEDGRRIVVPTESDLRVVELTGDAPETRVAVHAERVFLATADGQIVVGGERPGLYTLGSGERTVTTGGLSDAAVHDDALALVEAGVVRVVSRSAGEELGRLALPDVERVRWAGGGTRLVLSRGSAMSLETTPFPLHGTPISVPLDATTFGIDVSLDGSRVAAVILDSAVLIAEHVDGSPRVTRVDTRGWATDASWDGSGALAILEDGDRIVLLDPDAIRAVETLRVVAGGGGRIATAGDRIVLFPFSITASVRGATVFRRSGGLGPDARTLGTGIRDIAIDATRHRVVVATLDGLFTVELGPRRLGTPALAWALPSDVGFPCRVAVRPDGGVAVVTSRGALLLGIDGAPLSIVLPPDVRSVGNILGLAVAGDGDEILVGGIDGTVRRYSTRTRGEVGTLVGHTGAVTSIAFSPDGDRIATASMDQTVRLWTSRTGTEDGVLSGHADLAADVTFSPDGDRVATADGQGRVRIFATDDLHLVHHTLVHSRWVNRLTWTADGAHLATAADDGTVRVVAAADLGAQRIFRTRAAPIAVAFDGGRLVYHDGRELVRIDLRLGSEAPDPATALGAAEARAGVTLDGLMLVPRMD